MFSDSRYCVVRTGNVVYQVSCDTITFIRYKFFLSNTLNTGRGHFINVTSEDNKTFFWFGIRHVLLYERLFVGDLTVTQDHLMN